MQEINDIRKIGDVFNNIDNKDEGKTTNAKIIKPKEEKKKTKKKITNKNKVDVEIAKTKPEKNKEQQSDASVSSTKQTKKRKIKKRGKNYKQALSKVRKSKKEDLKQIIKALTINRYAKFNESFEIHVNLGIDPKNSDQRIRFTTTLPHGTGKPTRVLVITEKSTESATKLVSENIKILDKSAITKIENGKLQPGKDFDVVIATPEVMSDLAKVAKILGPKGMMPSPKNNTITEDLESTISDFSKGQIEIKNQSGHAVIHQVIGTTKLKEDKIVENIEHMINELKKKQPTKLKKQFIKNAYICTTMGPGIKIKL